MSLSPEELRREIQTAALAEGFELCGVCRPGPIPRADYFRRWLATGRAGTMEYLQRHVDSRIDLSSWLPWARSVVVVGLNYAQKPPVPPKDDRRRGKVATYAWGEDYHVVLREKLEAVATRMTSRINSAFQYRICVDTAAIIERELAMAAGVGWIGKNTLAIHPRLGSFFFLGVMATDLDITPDAPMVDHCGSCTRCLDACPTSAFPAPYEMDASRCISYLTIEHRGPMDPLLANKLDDWVYGCDDCQSVCPFNHWETPTAEPRFAPATAEAAFPVLSEILAADDATLRKTHKRRATNRARPEMWRRNAREILARADDSA
ncbi:MAG: tRNA epoxyqueuosine(34) reductase QueG [Phycisphaerales bacterium]|nr:tRNA epoxyqueuosine(34) reductase QueG [Phycisphaerales bacterium]